MTILMEGPQNSTDTPVATKREGANSIREHRMKKTAHNWD